MMFPLVLALIAWITPPARADTWDIDVQLYRDSSCMEYATKILMLDEGCYGNIWTNYSKAVKLKLVSFDEPASLILKEYSDDCYSERRTPVTLTAGVCRRWVKNSGLYIKYSIRYRATTCEGEDCSRLTTVIQTFYLSTNCSGLHYERFEYPLQRECMRWGNGTQTFTTDAEAVNITQMNYFNDQCEGSGDASFNMQNSRCYIMNVLTLTKLQLPKPRSFKWDVDQEAKMAMQLATAGAERHGAVACLCAVAFSLLSAISL